MKANYLVSRTYEIVTEESSRNGEAEESGFEYEDRPCDLQDVLRELESCYELSCSPVTRKNCTHVWASTEPSQDWRTGDYRSESVFVKAADGSELSSRRMFRIYRLAKLA